MNIVCVGGGPAGLYFALLARLRDPRNSVTVFERNRSGETFGWGVVLSDAALDTLAQADAPSAAAIRGAFKRWDAIDIHVKGRTVTSGGHGFCGIGRRRLLAILEQRCRELGVAMHHEREIGDVAALARAHAADMIVAADGVHGALRRQFAGSFRPELENAIAASSGSARASASIPSPSPLKTRRTAGSSRTPTATTRRCRPLSSRRRMRPGAPAAWPT